MIRNPESWHKWEAKWERKTPVDMEQNFKIIELLIDQARSVGKWPSKNPLEGIEVDIKIARVVNGYVKKTAD